MSARTQDGAAPAASQSAPAASQSAPEQDLAGLGGVSVGCFLSPCAQEFGYEKQHFCHMEGGSLGENELELLLDYWELDRPNLILEMLGPAGPYPKKLVSKSMLERPEIDVHENEVRDMLRVLGNEQADDEDTIITALGGKLYEKLIESTMALLKACEQTNSWIIFRDGPQTTIPLVRDALSRCDARPVIFVCEKVVGSYRENDVMDRILESKTSLAMAGSSQPPPTTKILSGWSQEYSDAAPGGIGGHPIGKNPCSVATHYIFSKSWSPINYSQLAPKGTFYICGGGGCAKSMLQNVSSYQPSVFMMHTGLACDIFGSAIEAILFHNCTTADAVVANMKERLPFRDDKDGKYFGLLDATTLYNHVTGLLAAHNANPREFKAGNVVLNSWTTTPEEVLNKLSLCFSSASSGGASLEVGAAAAKQQSITAAWKIHRNLQHNCGKFKWTSDSMTVIGTLLSLATTVFSVIAIWLEMPGSGGENKPPDGGELSEVLQLLLILLPALGGLVITSLSRFRYLSKWCSMHAAMMETESEIWKFRASSGEYDTSGLQEQNEDKKKKKKESKKEKKQDGNSTRRVFTARISETFSGLMAGEMQVDSLEEPSESTHLLIGSETANGEHKDGVDDNFSDLSGESYFQYRLIPQLDAFKKQAPVLSQRLMRYEMLILISTLITTLLATMQFKVWIPVAVAFSAMFATFMQYEGLQLRLAAVNGAITDLTRFSTDWAAMGVLERRGRLSKALMVQLTEGAILRIATAYAGGAASGRSSPGMAKGKDGEEKDKSKKDE